MKYVFYLLLSELPNMQMESPSRQIIFDYIWLSVLLNFFNEFVKGMIFEGEKNVFAMKCEIFLLPVKM
jgi:hypothetical protein